MKVLTLIDDDGHFHAFDVSTPEKEHKIKASILLEFVNKNYFEGERLDAVLAYISRAKSNYDEDDLWDDIPICYNVRGECEAVEVQDEWERNLKS